MKTSEILVSNQFPNPECASGSPLTFSGVCRAKLQALKSRLVLRLASEFSDLESRLVRRAVDDAEALVAVAGLPYLLLPLLAEEKVQSARSWSIHQEAVFRRTGMVQPA